jgi:excisionase family DNA binding protein
MSTEFPAPSELVSCEVKRLRRSRSSAACRPHTYWLRRFGGRSDNALVPLDGNSADIEHMANHKKCKAGDASRTGKTNCSCLHAPGRSVPAMMLSLNEAVAATGLSRGTLYIHIRTGELPSIQMGRRRLIRVHERPAWVENLPTEA